MIGNKVFSQKKAVPFGELGHRPPFDLRSESGASIVIALVFFLICAVVGSAVMTAATINSKAVATQRETQQIEYTTTSAAKLLASQLDGSSVVWVYAEKSTDALPEEIRGTAFAQEFWKIHGEAAFGAKKSKQSYVAGEADPFVFTLKEGETPEVYATITLDQDLNITAALSLDKNRASTAAYNMTVTLQCVPTYDNKGRLLETEWDFLVITKTNKDVQAGGQL